jgi:hypothetical protein
VMDNAQAGIGVMDHAAPLFVGNRSGSPRVQPPAAAAAAALCDGLCVHA